MSHAQVSSAAAPAASYGAAQEQVGRKKTGTRFVPIETGCPSKMDILRRNGERLVVQRRWEAAYEVPILNGDGGHGGGDVLVLSDMFDVPGGDPLGRSSGYRDGLPSTAVGIAGNESLATGQPVRTGDLGLGADLTKRRSAFEGGARR